MFIAPLIAFLLVLALVPPLRAQAPKLGLMDSPDARKPHKGHVPLIGGLVMILVFMVVSLGMGDSLEAHWPLYSALLLLLITGVVDDRQGLAPFVKFGVQFVAAILVVLAGGAQIHNLGNLFGLGDFYLGFMVWPFSIVCVVLLINAVNLMDGLDGLAGGAALVMLGWFAASCLLGGGSPFLPSVLVLMATICGFLFYNMRAPWRKRAVIFMGDAGSMSLGLLIAWYAIHLSDQNARVMEPISVAWVFALPIWDECAQFYRRVKERRHPFSPDLGHFHHHFTRGGVPVGLASLSIHGMMFVLGAVGVVGVWVGIPLPVLTVLWMAGILFHIGFSRNLENYTRIIAAFWKRS